MLRIVLVLALFPACSRSRDEGELFCTQLRDITCFDAKRDCERTGEPCRSSGPPRWHCYHLIPPPGVDAKGTNECLPTREMCEASRPVDHLESTPCVAAAIVYCLPSVDRATACTADLAECETYRAIIVTADGGGRCTPRRSVGQ